MLNTDNMSILGLTIDYGPYGMMDYFDPEYTCNCSDKESRYSYENQPPVCKFNLERLLEVFPPMSIDGKEARTVLASYDDIYNNYYLAKMRQKFGLVREVDDDKAVVQSFFEVMKQTRMDMTNTIRSLNMLSIMECEISDDDDAKDADKSERKPTDEEEAETKAWLDHVLKQQLSTARFKRKCGHSETINRIKQILMMGEHNPMVFRMVRASEQ